MTRKKYGWQWVLTTLAVLLFVAPAVAQDGKTFGGITFLGDRQGICVEIDGECGADAISFELSTCDANMIEKETFKHRMPFTLLVPQGTHSLTIKKDGQPLRTDQITISAEKVLEYQLP